MTAAASLQTNDTATFQHPSVWVRLFADDPEGIAAAERTHQVNFPPPAEGLSEDDLYIYLPITTLARGDKEIRQQSVVFALGDRVLVTLEPSRRDAPLDRAIGRLKRFPELMDRHRGIATLLLQSLNQASNQVVELASASLEEMNDEIQYIMGGVDADGREIGVSDISETMTALNEQEELVSRLQESQLLLARAARYLRAEIDGSDTRLRTLADILVADIDGVKEHAGFEHDKVRYLQQSVMTSLNVKQNQIVKVFTIITAVFLPPTLIATFYGMNFSVMPELSWTYGFTATIVLTLLVALLPLVYIKQKGWLR